MSDKIDDNMRRMMPEKWGEMNEQDTRDGAALRLLRRAAGDWHTLELRRRFRGSGSGYIVAIFEVGLSDGGVREGSAATIAEAADKCREALDG